MSKAGHTWLEKVFDTSFEMAQLSGASLMASWIFPATAPVTGPVALVSGTIGVVGGIPSGIALMADSYFDFLGENQNKTLRGMNTQSCAIVEHHATLYPNKPTLKTPEDMAMALRDPLLFREVFQTATQQKDEKTVKALKEFAGYELARINAEEQLKAEAEKAKLEAQQKIENSPVNQMLKAAETGAQLGGTEGKLTPPIKP